MKYLIRASWAVLIACFIIKLFGGNYFEIATNNENFIKICNFVDDNLWLKMSLACITYLIGMYFVLCIMLKHNFLTIKEILIFFPLIIFRSVISWYNNYVSYFIDILIMFVIPFIFSKNRKRILIVNILIIVFQLISLFIRNLGFSDFNENTTLISLIMQVDYYIMIFIYYLYTFNKKKEVT